MDKIELTVAGVKLTVMKDDRIPKGEIRLGIPIEEIVIWARRHVSGSVWIISTDKDLTIKKKYKPTKGSEFPAPYFEVHEKWRPDSLYRYVVTELNNYLPEVLNDDS